MYKNNVYINSVYYNKAMNVTKIIYQQISKNP